MTAVWRHWSAATVGAHAKTASVESVRDSSYRQRTDVFGWLVSISVGCLCCSLQVYLHNSDCHLCESYTYSKQHATVDCAETLAAEVNF